MKLVTKTTVVGLVGIALFGCDSKESSANTDPKEITFVKDYIYEGIDPTLSLGQAFNTRKICEEIRWNKQEDERGRTIVLYGCKLKGYEDYLKQVDKENVDKTLTQELAKIKELKKQIEGKKIAERYLAFVNELNETGTLSVFMNIKKQNPKMPIYLQLIDSQTEAGARNGKVPEKDIPQFIAASKIFTEVLNKNENKNVLYVNHYSIQLEEILTGKYGKLFDVNKIIDEQKQTLDKKFGNVETAKDEIVVLEKKIADSYSSIDKGYAHPVMYVQYISFGISQKAPVPMTCGIAVYDEKDGHKFVEAIEDLKLSACLVKSYNTNFDDYYIDTLKKLYKRVLMGS